jgi:hypothetical protein
MIFDTSNLADIAKDSNAKFVVKVGPVEDVEGKFAIEKQIN